ncbi:hypothetical protein B9Z19DRAFT_1066755 [Tuber borchii]|uniref:HNH nuclease domain-containing protein n=1 Tax=Tuber borchii TaxID=42251 RepID=A0A2T6ZLD3_TUBBO|nr:hypothetical protein B9Z19DRAFT_1066755 [Tuber borchii]
MTYGEPTGTFYDNVHARASPAGQSFLRVGRGCLTHELQQQLNNPPPVNAHECETAVVEWLERLSIIESALINFPNVHTRSPTSAPALARSAAGVARQNEIGVPYGPVRSTGRDLHAVEACHERDDSECVITGSNMWDGFPIEIAHIIPFALANETRCRQMDLWRMLEFFWGIDVTSKLYNQIARELDTTHNMVTLVITIHRMFDKGTITFIPKTPNGDRIPVSFSSYSGIYNLEVHYSTPLRVPELIQSTKVIGQNGAASALLEDSSVQILPKPLPSHPYPRAIYFTLRELILWLKRECEDNIGIQGSIVWASE